MSTPSLIGRYFLAFLLAAVVIGGAQFLKGHTFQYSITQALIWGPITAGVYIATAIYRFRKGQQCDVCNLPESVTSKGPSA